MNMSSTAVSNKRVKYFFLLAAFVIILFIPAIGEKRLWRTDEPRVAGISAEMARTQDYTMPMLNGEPFLEYPPLYYWVTAGFFDAFGRSPFTARLCSGLAAVFAVLLIYLLTSKMGYDPLTSFFSGVVLATSAQFWAIANRCLVDMTLCFFIVAAMASFYALHKNIVEKKKNFIIKLLLFIAFILSLAFGMLTKSLLGLAIPTCGLFFWLISEIIWNKKVFIKSWILLILGSILSLIPVALWVWRLYLRHGYDIAYTATWKNTFARFTGSYAQHDNSFFYYFGKLPGQFLPWTVIFVLIIIVIIAHRHKRMCVLNFNLRFITTWFIFPFILLCISSAKRSVYLLPLYPPLALFTSILALKIINESFFLSKFNWRKIIMRFSIFLLIIFVVIGILTAVLFNNKNSFYPMYKYYKSISNSNKTLYLYRPDEVSRGAVNFYMNQDAEVINKVNKLEKILKNKNNYAITERGNPLGNVKIMKNFIVKGKHWYILNEG
ncbi:MAG: glycosyltransferase family 39 protein [bacterium]|nr:glycosyltransferase family 39 protein [bacterium]